MNPRVSVIVPVYNAERYLDSALASVLADDYDAFEVIVVDDGSSDSSPEILHGWAERDARVIVHRQENRGIAEALNAGIAIARGEYIGRLDGDDLHVNRLRKQVEVLDREQDVVLVSTWFDLIDADGRTFGSYRPAEVAEITAWLLNFYNVIGGHAQVMFRRDAAVRAGGYRAAFSLAEDYDLWTRLASVGRIVALPFVGLKRRHHAEGTSQADGARQRRSSFGVMRRTLSSYLDREISDEEADAVARLWRGARNDAPLASAGQICDAAFARFKSEHGIARDHRRLRFIIGRRWCLVAARCARGARFRDAGACLLRGVAWHPLGPPAAFGALVGRLGRGAIRKFVSRWSASFS